MKGLGSAVLFFQKVGIWDQKSGDGSWQMMESFFVVSNKFLCLRSGSFSWDEHQYPLVN